MNILAWLDEKTAACEKRASEVDEELRFVYLDAARDNREACATVELLDALLDEATGYVEAISNGTAKHIDPAAAEALAARMNAALAAFRGEA